MVNCASHSIQVIKSFTPLSKSSLTMDALIALNRRELALQAELDEIRTQKAALLASLSKPAPKMASSLLTPTKAKSTVAAPPPAPKKAIIIRGRRASESTTSSVASKISAAAPSDDAVLKHWKAFKKTKQEQIAAAQPTWGKARVKTAIQNAYQLEHPANAAVLEQHQKAKDATKAPRAPSEWLQYVAAVREELGCSHKEAMAEAGRRRRASASVEA